MLHAVVVRPYGDKRAQRPLVDSHGRRLAPAQQEFRSEPEETTGLGFRATYRQ